MKLTFFKKYKFSIITFLTIIFLSFINLGVIQMDDVQLFPNADKVIHFIMYFSLTFIFMIENKYNATIESQRKISILPITGFILFGILIELLQSFITSYRSTDFTDGLSNVLGILAAVIIYKITYKKIHKILKRL